jgi:hypothetical protein
MFNLHDFLLHNRISINVVEKCHFKRREKHYSNESFINGRLLIKCHNIDNKGYGCGKYNDITEDIIKVIKGGFLKKHLSIGCSGDDTSPKGRVRYSACVTAFKIDVIITKQGDTQIQELKK